MVDPRPLDLSHLLLSTWVVITLCLRRLHGFALALRHRIAAGGATFKHSAQMIEEPRVREATEVSPVLRQFREDISFIANLDPVIHYAVANNLVCGTGVRAGIDQNAAS